MLRDQYNINNQKQMLVDNYEISKNLIKSAYDLKIRKQLIFQVLVYIQRTKIIIKRLIC